MQIFQPFLGKTYVEQNLKEVWVFEKLKTLMQFSL